MNKKYSLLLVEDVSSILIAIRDYLISDFDVCTCSDITKAKEAIDKTKETNSCFDLLITDIYFSDGTGFDLILYCKKQFPNTRYMLITAYDTSDYIDFICEHQISNIISKHSNLSLRYIYVTAHKLLSSDIFGVGQYFENLKVLYPSEMPSEADLKNRTLYTVNIRSLEEKSIWSEQISKLFKQKLNIPESFSKVILEEITTNAIYRACWLEEGNYKYQEKDPKTGKITQKENIRLEREDHFIIQYGYYNDFMIMVCQDNYGTLYKREVLYRLRRHLKNCPVTGLPLGLSDYHGRGLFLLREQLTNLIINIERNKKTEVICVYNKDHNTPYKGISIFELESNVL